MYRIYCLIWVICFLIKNKGHFEIVMQDDSFDDDNYWIYKDGEDNIIKTSFWDIIEDIYACNKI